MPPEKNKLKRKKAFQQSETRLAKEKAQSKELPKSEVPFGTIENSKTNCDRKSSLEMRQDSTAVPENDCETTW